MSDSPGSFVTQIQKSAASDPFAATLLPTPSQGPGSPPATHLPPLKPTDPLQLPGVSGAFDEETRQLLHYRLFHIYGAICIVMAALVSMSLLHDSILPPEAGLGRWTLGYPWLVFIETFAGTMYLWRRPRSSIATLRTLELALFLLIALIGGLVRYTVLSSTHMVESPDPRYGDLILRYGGVVTMFPIVFSILLYGVLIPNTRRRSLIVVGSLCCVSPVVTVLAAVENPALRHELPVIMPMTGMNIFMCGVIAVISAARTQSLRQQVYEARREAREVGPYTLKRKLGEGGMGEVYLAEHKLLKRPCAVKFIRAELAANPSNAMRFEREVRAMTALSHFNTVRIYDYGRADDGAFYYVMEYLDGLTLDSLVRTAGPLEPARAVYLLRQLCGALAEAHAAGLVHRDLKPGNILVSTLGGQHDVAKLLDFGLVQDLGAMDSDPRLTQTGAVVGTPAYMCPEQAGGDSALDARGDIYSLGAVAFFALAGRPPFEGMSVGKLLAAHLTQAPPLLTEVRKEVPNDVARIVDRCLAKSPQERFQSVKELDQALAACNCAGDWSSVRAAGWWSQHLNPACQPQHEHIEPGTIASTQGEQRDGQL